MYIYVDQMVLNWVFVLLACVCAGMIGYYIARKRNDDIIGLVIDYLSNEGFIRSFENPDGETEILKLYDGDKNGNKKDSDKA